MAGEDGTFISGLDVITCAYNKLFLVATRLVASTCMQVGSFSSCVCRPPSVISSPLTSALR